MDSRYAVRQLPTFELTRCRGYPPFGGYRTAALPLAARFIDFLTWQTGAGGPVEGRRPPLRGAASHWGPGGRAPPCWEAVGRRVSAGD